MRQGDWLQASFCFSKKLYIRSKQVISTLVLIYFGRPPFEHIKNKLYNILDCWFRDMLNFDFLEKDLGLVSQSLFLYDFSRKIYFMLYSINWLNFIVWSSLFLWILSNMCIVINCFPVFEVISFETNLSFLIKPFCYVTKEVGTKI